MSLITAPEAIGKLRFISAAKLKLEQGFIDRAPRRECASCSYACHPANQAHAKKGLTCGIGFFGVRPESTCDCWRRSDDEAVPS